MLNKRFIFNALGRILIFESLFMLLCACVSACYGEDDIVSFLLSFAITFGVGGMFWMFGRNVVKDQLKRESFIIVTAVWIVMSLFGSLPYVLSGAIPSFTNAFFETISGFTTTGASILNDIEALPHGILFWRSVTHLIGGMGIVVLAVAILPFFGFGGMQLYNAEAAGVTNDKLHPRITKTAKSLWGIYMGLIGLETIFLLLGGMPLFDALCHSFGTIASGGFSTKNASIAEYSPYIQYVIVLFMIFAGTNFALFFFVIKGNGKRLFTNSEFRVFLSVILIASLTIGGTLFFRTDMSFEQSFRDALFQVTSVVTSTGFVTADYTLWHPYLTFIVFGLMFSGACVGSTSGGIKLFRHMILVKNLKIEFRRMSHPNAVIPLKIGKKMVSQEIIYKVLAFLVLYISVFIIGTLFMTVVGLDMDSAFGAVATTMGGIGPGLGVVGPMNNFFAIPGAGKWILSVLMLLGRLELFSVLILFAPSFWKNK
ncbi:TrkH family potassium uptake protein [Plebeiibacterium marinum]|uniref:TrkH family potassium uptake protein n=1 Tax=Plebeiibacterium marinum TaxID=2992111 RepID=A0AAE3SL85_9BACT|nr:TrkH family potassium uptake protein [Plebeiobacterium marinum]MCW3807635.1 TrkH family potassium uptake protein [Plebeiobacterium marinum]